MKLTQAQTELLIQVIDCPFQCVDYYPPAKKLVEKGLAFFDNGYLKPTQEGILLLQRKEAE